MGSPRVDVVFRLWQCDKQNHGWREGLPLVLPARIAPTTGLHPPGEIMVERKKNTAICGLAVTLFAGLAGIKGLHGSNVPDRRLGFVATIYLHYAVRRVLSIRRVYFRMRGRSGAHPGQTDWYPGDVNSRRAS
jgi:hypothetical protein